MSVPPAWIVHVPLLSTWLPAGKGLPISAQFQPVGHARVVLTFTLSNVTVFAAPELWEVAAKPTRIGLVIGNVTLDAATTFQVLPSLEV